MIYLLASLLVLACTPFIVKATQRFHRSSRLFAGLLICAIAYNIVTHIILENMAVYGWVAVIAALMGALIFGAGDEFFFGHPQKQSRIFLLLIQVFLFVHATIDGAALVGSEIDAPHTMLEHQHDEELSISIVLHRLLFEVFIWKFFHDRFGQRAAMSVLINIASGTVIGFFASRALFSMIPNYFGLFEAFIGGALLHLVYDYFKDRLKGSSPKFTQVAASTREEPPKSHVH